MGNVWGVDILSKKLSTAESKSNQALSASYPHGCDIAKIL